MKLSAILAPMLAAKVDHAIIEQVILAYEAAASGEAEKGKEKARIRWRKWKESHPTNGSKRLQTPVNVSSLLVSGDVRVEDNFLTSEIEPQKEQEEKKGAQARDVSDFRSEFPDLDASRLEALIKHRRSKRAQITGHAARLFRGAAAECGLPISQAVDTCIDRNWITIKPDWLNKPQARGSPPPKTRGVGGVFSDMIEEYGSGQGDDYRSGQAPGSTVLSLPYRRTG